MCCLAQPFLQLADDFMRLILGCTIGPVEVCGSALYWMLIRVNIDIFIISKSTPLVIRTLTQLGGRRELRICPKVSTAMPIQPFSAPSASVLDQQRCQRKYLFPHTVRPKTVAPRSSRPYSFKPARRRQFGVAVAIAAETLRERRD
jgi:hypothetical protein